MKTIKILMAVAAMAIAMPLVAEDNGDHKGNENSAEHNKGKQGEKMREENREKREKKRAERAERRKEHREKRDGSGEGHGKKGQN